MPILRRFLDANARLSSRFDRRKDSRLYAQYEAEVLTAVGHLPPGSVAVDLGGGRDSAWARELPSGTGIRVVAVDVSPSELNANTSADETRLGDVVQGLPFRDAEVDLLVSRTVLEHVSDVEAAIHNIARTLRPGAPTIHLLPCRYALFAIAARSIRFSRAKQLLHYLIPSTRGVVEFDVYYDRTYPQAIKRIFREAGFRDVTIECTWDQSAYFHPIFPVFIAVHLYQRVVEALGLTRLASYMIVRAVR